MKYLSKRFVSTTALSLALVFVLSIGVSATSESQGDIGDLLDKVTTMTAAGRDAAAKASDSEAAAPATQTASAAPAPAEQSMGSAPGIVTGGTINVRSGPGTDYSKVTMLSTGKKVTLIGKAGDWYHVSFDGMNGYIFSEYIHEGTSLPEQAAPAASSAPAQSSSGVAAVASSVELNMNGAPGVVTGGVINVRTGPGTDHAKVTTVSTGKKVSLLGKANGWYHVSFDGVTGYISGEYIYEGSSLPASSSGVGEQIVANAKKYLGVRYAYGGSSPSGFDCSGLTMYLYKQYGYSLPHTAAGQYNCGRRVSRDSLLPGDLVFFTASGNGGRITHVGIYMGGGNIIHARYSIGRVSIDSLYSGYYSANYVGAVRIA